MVAFIGLPPLPTTNLVLHLDSWNKRCVTGYNPTTFVPSIKDIANIDNGNLSVSNVHYQPNTNDLYWDGTNLLTFPFLSNYNNIFSSGGTVCMVIYPYSTGGSNNGRIIGKSSDGAEFTTGWWLNLYDNVSDYAALKFARMTTSGNAYGLWTTGRVVKILTPHFIAIQFNDSYLTTASPPSIFVDGTYVALTATQSPTGTVGTDDTSSNIQIGNGLSFLRGFDGNIDVMTVYRRLLSREELYRMMSGYQDRYKIRSL